MTALSTIHRRASVRVINGAPLVWRHRGRFMQFVTPGREWFAEAPSYEARRLMTTMLQKAHPAPSATPQSFARWCQASADAAMYQARKRAGKA